MAATEYGIRRARPGDLGALAAMQARSFRVLGAAFHPAAAIEAFLRRAGTMDPEVIAEGSYWVATAPDGRIVGGGGLSRRVPWGEPGDGPGRIGPATLRGVSVAPDWARRGIARRLVGLAETAAAGARARRIRVTATLPGQALLAALGYRVRGMRRIELGDGLWLEAVEMEKELSALAPALRAA